jgi:hypothetical protein
MPCPIPVPLTRLRLFAPVADAQIDADPQDVYQVLIDPSECCSGGRGDSSAESAVADTVAAAAATAAVRRIGTLAW